MQTICDLLSLLPNDPGIQAPLTRIQRGRPRKERYRRDARGQRGPQRARNAQAGEAIIQQRAGLARLVGLARPSDVLHVKDLVFNLSYAHAVAIILHTCSTVNVVVLKTITLVRRGIANVCPCIILVSHFLAAVHKC